MHNFEFDGPGGSGAAKASAKGDRGRRESHGESQSGPHHCPPPRRAPPHQPLREVSK